MDISDNIHNWLLDLLKDRNCLTSFNEHTSTIKNINVGVIQGSGIGPPAYVIAAGGLSPINDFNSLIKYVDDTYLVIPARRYAIRHEE